MKRPEIMLRFFSFCLIASLMGGAAKAQEEMPEAPQAEMVKMAEMAEMAAEAGKTLRPETDTVRAATPAQPEIPQEDREALLMELAHKVVEAIRQKNFALADTRIEAMQRLLPAQSITLMRLRAWYALSCGQENEARLLYRQILNRIGNDENAGINLVILEARAGRKAEAWKILSDLATLLPDSTRLQAVRQAFDLSADNGFFFPGAP
jgi:Flp pilus assembly protein TadD